MTEANRRRQGLGWESWIDRQIREAQERGDFDNLEGAGKPIPGLDDPPDELWWIKRKLKQEGLSFLPPTLAVRKELEDALQLIARTASEAEVGRIVANINARIVAVNRTGGDGPPSTLMSLDLARVVTEWRRRRVVEGRETYASGDRDRPLGP